MAAYAALLSLNLTVEQHRHRSTVYPAQYPIQSVKQTITSLVKLFQDHDYLTSNEEFAELERETVEAAYAVEYVIDCYTLDPALLKSGYNRKHSSNLFSEDEIIQIIEKFVSLREKATCQLVGVTPAPSRRTSPGPSRSFDPLVGGNNIVGFEGESAKVVDRITCKQSNLLILPIVGVGGLGKTTLVQSVFHRRDIISRFNIRIWCTISQSPDLESVLSSFLQDLGIDEDHASPPGEQLHKRLHGQLYLIVLDDIWGVDVWDTIKSFFPDNGNKSRIIITTRVESVALYIGSCEPHYLRFLSAENCWRLFQEKVFGEVGDCPPQLVSIGKEITGVCDALPLAIVVIGGHLSNSDMTVASWRDIARCLKSSSFLHEDTDDWSSCLNILYFCYESLPVHLKPCFLYMGVFPEDHSISVALIIQMWVAEGFLKPNGDQCVEDVAIGYLVDLIQRNLIVVSGGSSTRKILYFQIHDYLRDLCLKKAHEYNFLRTRTYLDLGMLPGADRNYPMHLLPHASEVHRSISLRIGK